jgi:(S)-sulfolactate dehydrogenase
MKILISEFLDEEGIGRFGSIGAEVEYLPEIWRDSSLLNALVADADALVVRNQTQVTRELLASAPRLKVVARLGVGLDNIDVLAARARGVEVVWPRGSNAVAVAEYVIGALLLFARNLAAAAAHVAEGGWSRLEFGGFELWGKTLGLVGLGEVGLRVATRARALGMRVIATDPGRGSSESAVEEAGVTLTDLDRLFSESHVISLHAPLVPETRGLMDRAAFDRMRPGAYLINTARGGLVDAAALAEALRSGRLAGAMLDVTDPEPPPADHVLRGVPNLWITPHIGGLTSEAQQRVVERVVEGVRLVLSGRRPGPV